MDNLYIDVKDNLFFYDYNKWLIRKNKLRDLYIKFYKKVKYLENDLIDDFDYINIFGELNYHNIDNGILVYNALLSKKDYELLLFDVLKRNLYLLKNLKSKKKKSLSEFLKSLNIGIDIDKFNKLTFEEKKLYLETLNQSIINKINSLEI
jgi:hypothetical protein